jgi:hypothetical protein
VMPMAGQDAVLDRAAVQRKSRDAGSGCRARIRGRCRARRRAGRAGPRPARSACASVPRADRPG